MKYKFNNYSKKVGHSGGRDWYEWKVFIDEEDDKLDKVKSVEYELDPSYPDPIRIKSNRVEKFALTDSGWGRFQMDIRIHLKDGNDIRTFYVLDPYKNIEKSVYSAKE